MSRRAGNSVFYLILSLMSSRLEGTWQWRHILVIIALMLAIIRPKGTGKLSHPISKWMI
jgi:hypothetical protein